MEAVAGSSKDTLSSSSFEIRKSSKRNAQDPGGIWKCFICNLEEHYDYKGTKPPFAKHLTYMEDCYIMKDPFSPPNKNKVLVLGGDCSSCRHSVCIECSLFYSKRFCKYCALKNVEHFPAELQEKLMPCINDSSEDGE